MLGYLRKQVPISLILIGCLKTFFKISYPKDFSYFYILRFLRYASTVNKAGIKKIGGCTEGLV